MRKSLKKVTGTWLRRLLVLPITITVVLVGAAVPATSAPLTDVIVLPGATSAEGIAEGPGATFYAGDIFRGDIYKGDLRQGTAELFIDAPDGRTSLGMFVDVRHGLLFVAGGYELVPGGTDQKPGAFGTAFVYDISTGATVASYKLGDPNSSLINDVAVTHQGAYFTDSWQASIYFVPISPTGVLGQPSTISVSGPAADMSGEFNLNGIVATPDEETFIVSHTAGGKLYTVDPATGVSRTIEGLDVPHVDGIVWQGRQLWAVQGHFNQVVRIRLNRDLTAGTVESVITHEAFQHPASAILFGNRLAVVNAKFDTGTPPTADTYEVILVHR